MPEADAGGDHGEEVIFPAVLRRMRAMRFLIFSLLAVLTASGGQRPSILFCMADDWGWPHAGAYGEEGVATPSFDRLAREGALLHHVYTTSPSCTPSRNAVFTGKYHWQLGPGANLWSTLPTEHESFVHLLRDAGYRIGRNRAKSWGPGRIDSWVEYHGGHPAGPIFKGLSEFLNDGGDAPEPFFFWLGTSDPHRPYRLGAGEAAGIELDQVHLFNHFPDHEVVRRDVADYYFEVQRWDRLVGKAISELEERGLLENTIIVMTGDHGMPFPRGKGNLYDSGVRVPFAVRWGEGIPAGRSIEDFVSFVDLAPTLLEASGVEVPGEMSGRSFLARLQEGQSGRLDAEGRPHALFGRERHTPGQEYPESGGYPSRGLRTHDFLYIRNYRPELDPAGAESPGNPSFPTMWYSDCDGGPTKDYIIENRDVGPDGRLAFALSFGPRPAEELYDLREDPGQVRNLVGEWTYQPRLRELRRQLDEALAATGDPRAEDPDYRGFDDYPYFGGGGGRREVR
ncbi:MAG: sulfatase [Verrucomicrobiota bacterium JB023]|nr:sulfatase [Verrucomicrobiota bacterium JB023]